MFVKTLTLIQIYEVNYYFANLAARSCFRSKNRFKFFNMEVYLIVMQPFFSFRFWSQLFLCILLVVIIYIEVITYSILPFQWVRQPVCNPPKCSKVLLVADPQLIGSQIRGNDFVNFWAKWDSDRYMRRTFLQAFNYIQPEVIVFLGDIMDEGHISSDEEFFNDVGRFFKVFQISSLLSNIPKVFLPGDNDIGGIDDIMLPQVVHRFNKIFNQSDGPVSLDHVEFYKINFMTYELQEPTYLDTGDTESNIRVGVSHVPLLPNPTQFLKRIIKRIKPQILFSGHAHVSSHFIASESDIWKRKFTNILPNDTAIRTYNIHSGLIHEIVVPTCSYRMGVKNMGYGVALIDSQSKVLHYSVLWLPRRFIQLYIYLIIFSISFFCFFLSVFARLLRKVIRLCFCIYSKQMTHRHFLLP